MPKLLHKYYIEALSLSKNHTKNQIKTFYFRTEKGKVTLFATI